MPHLLPPPDQLLVDEVVEDAEGGEWDESGDGDAGQVHVEEYVGGVAAQRGEADVRRGVVTLAHVAEPELCNEGCDYRVI